MKILYIYIYILLYTKVIDKSSNQSGRVAVFFAIEF